MSQNLGSLPPLSHNVTLSRPPPPLTCDIIYGWPLSNNGFVQYSELYILFHPYFSQIISCKNLVSLVKSLGLGWLGHVERRMANAKIPFFHNNIIGTRRESSPRKKNKRRERTEKDRYQRMDQ